MKIHLMIKKYKVNIAMLIFLSEIIITKKVASLTKQPL
jgi:hypothetical protein